MSKDRQWIVFICNHCVWALLEGGKNLELCLNSVTFVRFCSWSVIIRTPVFEAIVVLRAGVHEQ
jgi:hypothetical protein